MNTTEYGTSLSNREYKSSAFTAYFSEPENAANLYRALAHSPNIKASDIVYRTLEGVMFLARKNDMAFTIRDKVLVIGEHQSTVNLNMPLRSAIYYGRTMELLIPSESMYRTSLTKIPTPEFYMFYNGQAAQPAEKLLRLSDAYLEKTNTPMLELTVRMININLSVNHALLKESSALYEYSFFIQSIRDRVNAGFPRDEAIADAMNFCISEGIMTDFISRHGSEVRNMLYTQFNWDDALRVAKEEMREEMAEEIREEITEKIREEFSKEWEQKGMQKGILALIETCKELLLTREETCQKLISKFGLEPQEAKIYMNQYWS